MMKLAKGAKAQGKPKKANPHKQVDSSEDEEMEESEEELMEVPVKTPSKKAATPAKATPGEKAATPAKAAATPGEKRATPAAAKNGKKAKKAKKEESEEEDDEEEKEEEKSDLLEEEKPAAKKEDSEEKDDNDDDNDNDDEGCFADLTMASISRRRRSSNDPNIFCYICGNFTVKTLRCNITDFVKRVYFAYFKVKLGDQDKHWAPHKVCKTCIESLGSWSQGKNAKLQFGVSMVWREPSNHLEDCYFCLVEVKGFNKKNKQYLQYPSIPSAIRPVAHSEDIPVPKFTALPENVDTELSSHCYTDEEDSPDIFRPCDEDCDKPILFTQSDLNDLVRDLYLPRESAELWASRLQENQMLKPCTSVSFYSNGSRTA